MTKYLFVFLAACTVGEDPDPTTPTITDPWPVLDREQREGPPRYASRVHSCSKLRYRTLGNVLASRGVNIAGSDPLSAGSIYTNNAPGLGAPAYAQRVRENVEVGLATQAKIFDIFVQAAPEIIASMPSRPECGGAVLFDASNKCQKRGISCLLGLPATQTHVDLCDQTVARAADVEHGKQLAVAVLAAAAHTCE
jgi:hypothetical protein